MALYIIPNILTVSKFFTYHNLMLALATFR